MEHDGHERPSRGIKLPDFPGEQGQLRSHDGRIWKQSAITILAPFGLVITAMTGVPPRVAEIIDTDVDSIPEFQPGHPEYASNTQRRMKVERENQINAQRRMRIVLEEWTKLFEAIRSCCVARAPLLANDLFELCALATQGITGGHFDGPLAWRIVDHEINKASSERSEADKKFYQTALQLQMASPCPNGVSQDEFIRKAFAFVQYIAPNLAQSTDRTGTLCGCWVGEMLTTALDSLSGVLTSHIPTVYAFGMVRGALYVPSARKSPRGLRLHGASD